MQKRVLRNVLIAACTALGILTACTGGKSDPISARPALDATYRASGHAAAGEVFVHLFEWPWPDVANECETHLAPKGVKAVQVSPPQEDVTGAAWWTRYQPVSYSIAVSRSGTAAQFVDMVNRCKAVGVDIYVDAVINHMTSNSGGTGRNGTVYTKYNYAGLYTQSDFHTPCTVNDYQSATNVQDCELGGLADLNTGSATVRQKIADYLLGLARLGVAGFRIDSAKHIHALELNDIVSRVNLTLASEGRALPYYFGEVVDYSPEAVMPHDYFGLGYSSGGWSDITEFKFRGVGYKFLGNGQYLAQLNPNGSAGNQFSESAWGLMPADKAVVFLDNHDTQRSDGIPFRDGQTYRLASVFMLAQPYGYPSVMSSYFFDPVTGWGAGPPATGPGCAASLESAAAGQWVCEHRDMAIANMIAFRRAVAGTAQLNWWDDGANAIAFSRGDKGFVAINHETGAITHNFSTGLAAGNYCDVLAGGVNAGACAGQTIVVAVDGSASITLSANTAVVLQKGVSIP